MLSGFQILREVIRGQIIESHGVQDLVNVICRLQVRTVGEKNPTVPDILTNIRALPGVVVVKQLGAIRRIKRGREFMKIEIKYMPDLRDEHEFLPKLGKLLKSVSGVEIVRVISLRGRQVVRKDGRPWVF